MQKDSITMIKFDLPVKKIKHPDNCKCMICFGLKNPVDVHLFKQNQSKFKNNILKLQLENHHLFKDKEND